MQEPYGSRSKRIPFSWVSFGGETQLCASLFKSAPPRTLPVAPFHSMAPCPLDLCVLDHTWRVRCLGSCPISLLALGGLAVPPPDIFRHSAPSPRQVSRQGHADQQSWFFEPHHPPVEAIKSAPPFAPSYVAANHVHSCARWRRLFSPAPRPPHFGGSPDPLWCAPLPRAHRSSPPE